MLVFSCRVSILAYFSTSCWYSSEAQHLHGVQRRMISVDNFFVFFRSLFFCFVVAICDLVHAVEAMYDLP